MDTLNNKNHLDELKTLRNKIKVQDKMIKALQDKVYYSERESIEKTNKINFIMSQLVNNDHDIQYHSLKSTMVKYHVEPSTCKPFEVTGNEPSIRRVNGGFIVSNPAGFFNCEGTSTPIEIDDLKDLPDMEVLEYPKSKEFQDLLDLKGE